MATINNTFGTLTSAPNNSIINAIYKYVSTIFAEIKCRESDNENAITNRICKSLNSKKPSEYPFYFHHQNIESSQENTSTDFAAFGTFAYALENYVDDEDSPPLVKFEAKRLNSTLPSKREREYVRGEYVEGKCINNSGGVERFKNERHGKDVMNACLVGYIQTDSPDHWFSKVNGWIKEQIDTPSDSRLVWEEGDLLTLNGEVSVVTHYTSLSKRLSGDEINLKHFWINFIA